MRQRGEEEGTKKSEDFSNSLWKADIERLAEVDEHEVVREVQVNLVLGTS